MNGDSYLSVLEAMRKNLDNKLGPIRQNYIYHMQNTKGNGWLWLALWRSLTDLKGYSGTKPENIHALKLKLSTGIVTWFGFGAYGFFGSMLNFDWESISSWLLPIIWVILRVNSNIRRMTSISDSYFHIGAYKFKKPEEFELISDYIQSPGFTYTGLYHLFRDTLLVQSTRRGEEIRQIRESFEENVESLTEKIVELTDYQIENEELHEEIRHLRNTFDQLAQHSKQTLELLNFALTTLYRLRSSDGGLFNPYDLRICSDFSLFELKEDCLVRILEQGNSTTPQIINLNEQRYQWWSAVRVVKNNSNIEYSNLEEVVRCVDSYRFVIDGRVFVYNFHFERDTDKELRELIMTRQLYRLVKVICHHLIERGLLREAA